MQSIPTRLRSSVLALTLGACGVLAGCEGTRESVAAAIAPASAQDVAAGLRQKLGQGKFKEAHDEGAAFLAGRTDAAGAVAWETAKASAQAGLHEDAIRFATLAVRANAVPAVDLMAEPLLEPVHTDARLLALVTDGGAASAPAKVPPNAPASAAATDGAAQATVGAGAVKASAGGVSVELPE